MTSLKKPVSRTTTWRAPHGVAPQVVITLYPGGVIGLREHRRRKEVQLEAAQLYTRALLEERRKERRRSSKAQRT
jgi:hypothetical protein